MTAGPVWASVDPETRAILELINGDPIHERDREAVVDAIVQTGRDHDGLVDPNVVRGLLNRSVYPRVVGPVYNQLRHAGVLEHAGWTISTDTHGRNSGRPARLYRVTRTAVLS